MSEQSEIAAFLEAVEGMAGVSFSMPAAASEIDRVEGFAGVRLPAPHRELLLRTNGISVAFGYERVLGVGDDPAHLGPWNVPDMWKFAWSAAQLEDYLVFAQTGWGDQYAYRISDLRRGIPAVWRLDCHLMAPGERPLAPSFEVFLRGTFGQAREPGNRVQLARQQVGDLTQRELAVFSPSPLLVGPERATRLVKMSARVAMIANGDLKLQLVDLTNQGGTVEALEPYKDEQGRPRLRVKWVEKQG